MGELLDPMIPSWWELGKLVDGKYAEFYIYIFVYFAEHILLYIYIYYFFCIEYQNQNEKECPCQGNNKKVIGS